MAVRRVQQLTTMFSPTAPVATLDTLRADLTFTRDLPGDAIDEHDARAHIPRPVHDALFSHVRPTAFAADDVRVVCVSAAAAAELDLPPSELRRREFVELLQGRWTLPGCARPWAANYAGHQFGVWAGQLGDGRAISVGEVLDRRERRWELQLKGAGPTPYSRQGDGRAVVRSSVREFLASEAMHALGVPTTRTLALAVSPRTAVRRETVEQAAVVCRLAPSWLRFGSFQLPYARQQPEMLRQLADFLVRHHLGAAGVAAGDYVDMLREIVRRTAELVAHWQAVGFCHGVLNTDNMSVLGLTLDYGPFAFLNAYEPGFVSNTSDDEGRYSFQNQPSVGLWNLTRLALALTPLIPDGDAIVAVLEQYTPHYTATYLGLMRKKLGLTSAEAGDEALVRELLAWLAAARADYTHFFRVLGEAEDDAGLRARLRVRDADRDELGSWLVQYRARLQREPGDKSDAARRERMRRANPKYILRNHLAQQAIDAAEQRGDYGLVESLLTVLSAPHDEHAAHAAWAEPPEAGSKAAAMQCSCSS